MLRLAPYAVELLLGRVRYVTRARLDDVDLVVLVGGSNIYDNPSVRTPLSLARLFGVLYPAWAAHQLGIPVVMAGHTLGPFPRRSGRLLARTMLRGVRSVALREETSKPVARRLGLRDARVLPDFAFATEPVLTPRVRAVLADLPAQGARTLCVAPRRHPHAGPSADDRVVRELETLARSMVASGDIADVILVPQCHGPTPIEDDRELTRVLASRLDGLTVRLVDDDLSPGELAALYGRCRLVVGVRLHAAILAMSQGTPAFAISYMTRKTEGVMSFCGLADSWAEYEEFTASDVLTKLGVLLAPETRAMLEGGCAVWTAQLQDEVASWEKWRVGSGSKIAQGSSR